MVGRSREEGWWRAEGLISCRGLMDCYGEDDDDEAHTTRQRHDSRTDCQEAERREGRVRNGFRDVHFIMVIDDEYDKGYT